MNILVTTGNTQTPIDRVRCLTNIFSGRTGTQIALEARRRGHAVCLLTSHPEVVGQLSPDPPPAGEAWQVQPYRTFDELHDLMADRVCRRGDDAIIHTAAVSDYQLSGIYAPATGTTFDANTRTWRASAREPRLADVRAGKVRSSHPELWLRLVPTPKLVDLVRTVWGFRGIVVKFKLEVGADEEELLAVAEQSRQQSDADVMVANTLEGMHATAYLGTRDGSYRPVARANLPAELITLIEEMHRSQTHLRSGGTLP